MTASPDARPSPSAASSPRSGWRLHRGGKTRAWLARTLGTDEAHADRLYRRVVHGAGVLVLLYYLLPAGVFVVVPNWGVLVIALAVAVVLDALRLAAGLELPTIRDYEAHRPASFVFYATALVGALLLLPEPIGAAVILGTALVDPLAGELRGRAVGRAVRWGVPIVVYGVLAFGALTLVGRWPWATAGALAAAAGVVAVVAERVRLYGLDDDLTMTAAPAVLLYGVGVVLLGLPR